MKNRIVLFLLFLSLAFSCFASAETRWECVDPRDGYVFRFNNSDIKLKGTNLQWGNLTEVKTTDGKVLLVSEYALFHVFRCSKEEGKSW